MTLKKKYIKMWKYDLGAALPNLMLDFPNGNFLRQRTPTENLIRVVANGCPAGRFADSVANGVELYAHASRANANAYYQNNARGHTDEFEKCWDSFKRATDIDYS